MSERRFAFVGAGLAGLLLASRLSHGPLRHHPMVLVDPVLPDEDRRSFGYWFRGPSPFDDVALRSWSQLGIATPAGVWPLPLGPYRYHLFKMADWRRTRWHLLDRRQVAWVRATAHGPARDGARCAAMTVDGATLRARWIFDSRFDPRALPESPRPLLWQSFRGGWIESSQPVFDPELPLFMDFRVPQPSGGLAFGYALPTSARRALVERVTIAPDPVRPDLDGYLARTLGLKAWRIEVAEGGVTPMTTRRFPRRRGTRTLTVGIAGGRLKPSSGYGIHRILRDTEAIASSLERVGHPFDIPDDRSWIRWFDTVMLRVMRDEPGRMVEVFEALLTRGATDRVLRFLDENPHLLDVLSIVGRLPKGPFLRAILRMR